MLVQQESKAIMFQKKLSEIDNNSEERWKLIEKGFQDTRKKMIEESTKLQHNLKQQIAKN